MAGKAYTMREMKAMVEYLTERKAFSEIRGRKMWMEFANSGKTTRTWQSLKETFLKRIMPDLHNPYYKLTLDQVRSFREGKDVAEKEKHNRLEYTTASEDSVSTSDIRIVNKEQTSYEPEPTTSKEQDPAIINLDEEVERVTGKETPAKIDSRNRSSADTVVLETYENAEQLQQVLESPSRKEEDTKPLKDLLIFEPMTPLIKELLEDFETESENEDEYPVSNNKVSDSKATKVVENVVSDDQNPQEGQNTKEIKVGQSTDLDNEKETNVDKNNTENTSQKLKKPHEANNNGTNEIENIQNDTAITVHDSNFVTAVEQSKSVDKSEIVPGKKRTSDLQISGNTTSDTILPNNQECLNNNKSIQNVSKDENEKVNGKRAASMDRDNKKQKTDNGNDKQVESIIEIHSEGPMLHEEVPIIEINSEVPDVGSVIEINTDTINGLDDSEVVENNTTNIDEPINENDSIPVQKEDEQRNPCLQSVNLFEEQFKNTQYSSDSDNRNPEANENQVVETPPIQNKPYTKESDLPIKVPEDPEKLTGIRKKAAELLKKLSETPKTATELSKKPIELPKKTIELPKKTIELPKTSELPKEATELPKKATELPKKATELPKKVTELPKKATELPQNVHEVIDVDRIGPNKRELKLQRDKVLSNVFGFSNGGASTSRRKARLSLRRSHRRSKNDSGSSEWLSESDSDDYVSPPRPSRHKRKILKPKSSRILQDPEEGMLYVVFGKNIYPLVKDGRQVKNFVTYKRDSSSDSEDESFWKKKYIEEKKKTEEFKKLIKDHDSAVTNERASPILQSSAKHNTSTIRKTEDTPKRKTQSPQIENKKEVKNEKLVFKFVSGHGEQLQLEGGWTQISSAIPEMMQMLRNNQQSNGRPALKIQTENVSEMEISSGKSTPVIMTTAIDPEVHEKVNKIETEIFKEIEEREKEESQVNEALLTVNVAKRRGRPRKTPSPIPTPAKKAKKDITEKQDPEAKETENKTPSKELAEPKETKIVKKKSSLTLNASTSKKEAVKSPATSKQNETTKQKSSSKESETSSKQSETSSKQIESSSKQSETSKSKATPLKQTAKQKKESVESTTEAPTTRRRSNLRLSKQSDISEVSKDKSPMDRPPSVRQVRTPRKYDTDSSTSELGGRARRSATKEKTNKNVDTIDFEDDNVRFMFPPSSPKNKNTKQKKKSPERINVLRNMHSVDSTQGYQDSDISPLKLNLTKRKRKLSLSINRKQQKRRITRWRSYPTLMQDLITSDSNSSYFVPVRRSQSTTNSEAYRSDSYQLIMHKPKISFNKLEPIKEANDVRHFSSVSQENSDKSSELNILVEIGTSSVSLPISPEISVVENLSISRDIIDSIRHTEPHSENSDKMDFNEYMISEVNVSKPLMNQDCKRKSNAMKDSLTETFMNKVCSVNIVEQTLSETLDQRLRNLLLESNKKKKGGNDMEVDAPVQAATRKTVAKKAKRCSTPRKKQTVKGAKAPKDAIIDEHVETCSFGVRQSCPPVLTLLPDDKNTKSCTNVKSPQNKRRKKDIIKVKIQRPKDKITAEKSFDVSVGNISRISNYTDSGINDAVTEISGTLRVTDSSVDLIHNHSETCLLANECVSDSASVQFVENSSSSIISLNSSHPSLDSGLRRLLGDSSRISEELFGTAQDNPNSEAKSADMPESMYHSPLANNSSLLTEDLSDEVSPAKPSWYLLSEDETNTQTNMVSFGANLNDLFPIACAVPNLSTISEMSKENEDSRKPYSDAVDNDTRDMLNMF